MSSLAPRIIELLHFLSDQSPYLYKVQYDDGRSVSLEEIVEVQGRSTVERVNKIN